MHLLTIFLASAIIIIFLFWLLTYAKHESCVPDGPRGIPVLGNLLQFLRKPYLVLSGWAEKHGTIFTIFFGGQRAFVISSVEDLTKVLNTPTAGGPLFTDALLEITNGQNGLGHSSGKAWLEQRKFLVRNLSQFGIGSVRLEKYVLNEITELKKWINKSLLKSYPHNYIDTKELRGILQIAVISSTWFQFTGSTLKVTNNGLSNTLTNLLKGIQRVTNTGCAFFPFLKYILPEWSGFRSLQRSSMQLNNFIMNEFISHQRTFVKGVKRDMMDSYINQTQETDNSESAFYQERGIQNSIATFKELLIAGTQSSSESITWALIYLAVYQEVQAKLYQEIKDVVGLDKNPTWQDTERMPYTNAVILETFRCSSLAWMGVPYKLADDLNYNQYRLPKGSIIIPNLYHIHHDKKIWRDPENFRPERYFGEDGERQKGAVIPFSVGKRKCPGGYLAKKTIFLFLVKLCQTYQFDTMPLISKDKYLEPTAGIFLLAGDHTLVINARFSSPDSQL